MEELLTPEQVGRALRVPRSSLYRWHRLGEGPPVIRVGKHLRYPRVGLEKWLAELAEVEHRRRDERGAA